MKKGSSKFNKAQIKRLYDSGLTLTAIAETVGASIGYVSVVVHGSKKISSKERRKRHQRGMQLSLNKQGRKRVFSHALIVQMYRDGVRQCDIARELGCDKGLVSKILKRGENK